MCQAKKVPSAVSWMGGWYLLRPALGKARDSSPFDFAQGQNDDKNKNKAAALEGADTFFDYELVDLDVHGLA